MKLKITLSILIASIGFLSITNGYFFGLKSADNTTTNIQQIEEKYNMNLSTVAFIFDPRTQESIDTLNNLNTDLGNNRIYHITVSPGHLSAKQVAEGAFDKEYKEFFQIIKGQDLRIIFRTMHEMNGGRYPRSSDPDNFKKAWIHIRNIAKEEGLTHKNILFDFSINHRDMPTKGTPSQTARLIPCQIRTKEVKGCYTFEDYYPGDEYVDIMGFSFYNRGKASYDRARISPSRIVNQRGRNTLSRLESFHKPIFIDEVATTAIRYGGGYSQKKSMRAYQNQTYRKNVRLRQLKTMMEKETSIVGLIYFNVDYTHGLTERLIGEGDRAAINIANNKVYTGIFDLYKKGEKLKFVNQLLPLFNIQLLEINGIQKFIQSNHIRVIKKLVSMIDRLDQRTSTDRFLNGMYEKGLLSRLYKRFSDKELKEIIQETKEFILE